MTHSCESSRAHAKDYRTRHASEQVTISSVICGTRPLFSIMEGFTLS